MNNSKPFLVSLYPIEAALEMEDEVSTPWQQWQQKSSGDLTDDFVRCREEQHMTLPNLRQEDVNEAKYRFLPVSAFRRSSSTSSQYSVQS
jgi:hypothetical protein